MNTSSSVIETEYCIIGGGIAGLSCAWQLARAGRSVVLVERGSLGQGATAAAGGMLAPLVEARLEERDLYDFGAAALGYYAQFAREVEQDSGMQVGFRSEGTLVVALDRDDLERLRHLYQEQLELGLPVEWLSGYDCRQLEPSLATSIPGGLFSKLDQQVDNRLLAEALATACRKYPDAKIFENAGEGELENLGRGGPVYRTGDLRITARRIVLATGAHTDVFRTVLPAIARKLRPVKGQIIRLDQSRMPLLAHVVRTATMYLVPKADGRLVLGASAEDRGFDDHITAGEIYELLRKAWECVPGIYELPIAEISVGFRPATIDHKPLLGPTDIDEVVMAGGYYRHGILFAPYASSVLAEYLLDGTRSRWLETFSPKRFHEADIERIDSRAAV